MLVLMALLLAACAANAPVPLESAKAARSNGIYAYGTLATNPAEAQLAPLYTRNALLRLTAARRLEDGRLDVAAARDIQALADQARTLIDRARNEDAPTRTALASQASALQDEAATKLEATK
jgi:hypothetical protein